jgi:hypothetical protein
VIDQLDKLIRKVLVRELGLGENRVRFDPPDDYFRGRVANDGPSVSVYLVDLRENRALRDPEWLLEFDAGQPQRRPGPLRVNCHYLISAWSRATAHDAVEPTLEEHLLLYRVLGALAGAVPLRPSHYYPAGSNEVDPLIFDADLPVAIVPAEGWPKLTEFWAGMGRNSRVRPAIWYTVTLPVVLPHQVAGPLVTTRIVEFRQGSDPSTAEQWLQIAGTVPKIVGGKVENVGDAVVTVSGAGGRVVGTATTSGDGRFSVGALQPEGYNVRAVKSPLSETKPVALPGRTGDYDRTVK